MANLQVLQDQQGAERLLKFVEFYNSLSSNNLSTLASLYHPEVVFIDAVHQINGLTALEQYFQHAYARLDNCRFVAKSFAQQGDIGFVSWQMQFSHAAIGHGKSILVDGCTQLQWHVDGGIIFHRDFYDLDQMVFQHLPIIGWITGKIKQKMAQE